MSSCLKSKYFLFLCVSKFSNCLIWGSKVEMEINYGIFLWVKNRVPIYIIIRDWIEHMLLTSRNTDRHSQMISTAYIFCFQMQSSHYLRSTVFPSFTLFFNLWSLRRMPPFPIKSCISTRCPNSVVFESCRPLSAKKILLSKFWVYYDPQSFVGPHHSESQDYWKACHSF